MSKIHAFITIPVMELTEIVAKCGAVVGAASQLISKYYTEPTKKKLLRNQKLKLQLSRKKKLLLKKRFFPVL